MKWFKHDSDSNQDAKLRKLRIKHGMRGYGLYWYCLELIAHNVDEHNLTFELEHDAEILAHDTGIDSSVIEEMMRYMVNLGLFEAAEGRISCLKMLKRIDTSMTSNEKMRKLITEAKTAVSNGFMQARMPASHDPIMIESCLSHDPVMQDKNRTDKKRTNGDEYAADFIDFWTHYPRKENKAQAAKAWKKLKPSPHLVSVILNDLTNRAWGDAKFIPHGGTYLNGRRWEDEQQSVPSAVGEVYR